jgi:hypothetical protein
MRAASEVQRTSLTLSLTTNAIARSPQDVSDHLVCSRSATRVSLTWAHCIYSYNGRARSDRTPCAGLFVIGGNIFIQIHMIGGDKECLRCSKFANDALACAEECS